MLELKGITKVYPAGGDNVHALKGIDLRFRDSEFVSILGQSGCGKTTMLNIIGGLDGYTDGDLVINGVSTKQYKDRDWDAYRNYSVGFVFQSYNLIPHQTVLQNVELALTLSGVSKKERKERAKEALRQVGLSDQLRKHPNEMSGGQCQRVAIARAIVNNPDIILADEPTGALDTETSVQVMDILREIAKDRLVVMVTHNPDLAEKYSTRIVNMLDGKITGDSRPVTDEEWSAGLKAHEAAENTAETEENAPAEIGQGRAKKKKARKKPSMSLFTSFGLSLNNLFTKKGRTALTSFAGSIGIIGIALIYSVSNGTTTFVDSVQEETLSSYPLTIEASTMDWSSLLSTFMGNAESVGDHEKDAIYQKAMIYEMLNSVNSLETKENDLKSFKSYIDAELADSESRLSEVLTGVQYTYDTNLVIYTKNVDGDIVQSDTQALMMSMIQQYSGVDMSALMSLSESTTMGSMMSSYSSSMSLWQELLPGNNGSLVNDVTRKQYDLVYGDWPDRYDEVILFVDENNEIDDLSLFALGLTSQEEINSLMEAAMNQTTVDYEVRSWSFEEICGMEFKTVLASDCYTYDELTGTYTDLRDTDTGLKYLYDNGLTLHVVGIAKPSADSAISSSSDQSSLGYTSALTEYIIEHTKESAAVKAQLADPTTDIFTGLPFEDSSDSVSTADKAQAFTDYIAGLDDASKAALYVKMMSVPDEALVEEFINQTLAATTMDELKAAILSQMTEQTGMDAETISSYVDSMSEDDLLAMIREALGEQYAEQYAAGVSQQMAGLTTEELVGGLGLLLGQLDESAKAEYYDEITEFSDSTYEDNLSILGVLDLDSPSSVNLYASSFENKDVVEDIIAEYNEGKDDLDQITYTDYIGLMMSSVTTIINAITYVLIAFVAVSLIVSSIMIGVITLISVQERTKEIGILRAIGASKRNVSSMFNAETVIIGFTSGFLGVLITYLLCIPINLILHHVTGISSLSARLPINVAVVLILISMFLTLIAGVIPSRSAAKKDPVVALRTE